MNWFKKIWQRIILRLKRQTVTFNSCEIQKGDIYRHASSGQSFKVTSTKAIPAKYEEIPILDDDGNVDPFIPPYRYMVEAPSTEVKIKRIKEKS